MILDLTSPLSREECVHRLRSKVGTAWDGAAVIGCMAMIVSLASGTIPVNRWPQAMMPFSMLSGGVALLKVGQFLSRDEADFLVDFLRKTFEARDNQSASG
jgi:hypothetical protein